MSLSPASEALAFRMWAYCEPIGWDCTRKDVADELGESVDRVRRVAQLKGWSNRFRAQPRNSGDVHNVTGAGAVAASALFVGFDAGAFQ